MTQEELFWDSHRKISECNQLFLYFVADGMTAKELEENIRKRPGLWGRFSNWLDKLP